MFSSTSHAEWTKVSTNDSGNPHYVDFDRIREHNGYVYYWVLHDYLKPNPTGALSAKAYQQGDCNLMRVKYLSFSFHEAPMGKGDGNVNTPQNPYWEYMPPNSIGETTLKAVCNR